MTAEIIKFPKPYRGPVLPKEGEAWTEEMRRNWWDLQMTKFPYVVNVKRGVNPHEVSVCILDDFVSCPWDDGTRSYAFQNKATKVRFLELFCGRKEAL